MSASNGLAGSSASGAVTYTSTEGAAGEPCMTVMAAFPAPGALMFVRYRLYWENC